MGEHQVRHPGNDGDQGIVSRFGDGDRHCLVAELVSGNPTITYRKCKQIIVGYY